MPEVLSSGSKIIINSFKSYLPWYLEARHCFFEVSSQFHNWLSRYIIEKAWLYIVCKTLITISMFKRGHDNLHYFDQWRVIWLVSLVNYTKSCNHMQNLNQNSKFNWIIIYNKLSHELCNWMAWYLCWTTFFRSMFQVNLSISITD